MKEYYSKNDFILYKGDCIEVLNAMPANSIDMIFADPPYFLSDGSFTCQNGKRVSVKKGDWDLSNGTKNNFDFHSSWLAACKRVLKPNGTIWVSGTYHSIYQCGVALENNGFHFLNDIAWFKPNAAPNLSCRFFTASHETIIWARKDKKGKHTFNYKLMKEGSWKDDLLKKEGLQMRSVWSISTPKPSEKKFGKHPTQKPLELLKRIILASTKKGDLILDPFTGSSTTGISAILNNRRFIGIDNEKKYLDLSIKRYEDIADIVEKKYDSLNYKTNNYQYQLNLLEKQKKYISKKEKKVKKITRKEAILNIKKYINKDLMPLAKKYGITTYETGKQNKGWKGQLLERLAGLNNNSSKAPNGDTWELKSVCFKKNKKGEIIPKETMAITMINPVELLKEPFDESHCWKKLSSIVLCAVMWHGKNSENAELINVSSFDFINEDNLAEEIAKDYEFIRNKLKTEGFDKLTGKDGIWIQARTKGSKGSNTRAFYARKELVKKIFESANRQ